MLFYGRIIFLICLCMGVGACVSLPTYSGPQLDNADASEIAILKHGGLVNGIKDADGNDIPVRSSEPHPLSDLNKLYEEFRLVPGEYEIRYSVRHYKQARVSGESRVTLKAGHVYAVKDETCYTFCSRLASYTSDIWLEDITTGEWIGGCRQGMGCVEG